MLCPPNSLVPFRDLPKEDQIGGYPTLEQMTQSTIDASEIDSEGRCVILEFPAFVLLGVYAPANRDESRDEFRMGFLNLLDARVRNLVSLGKRVILTGDLNISREVQDAAWVPVAIRKREITADEFISSPARRLFNHLLEGGKVIGPRDESREQPVLHDPCRAFHPDREGMYTCWETKVNARPGNYGARIDYVLSSIDMRDWFADANIQEGLMGSDHCPVYTIFADKVTIDGQEVCLSDLLNPPGTFNNGTRLIPWSSKFFLPMSGKLITEFDRRRSIKDMFSKKPSTSHVVTVEPSPFVSPTVDKPVTPEPASQSSSTQSSTKANPLPETKKALGKRTQQLESSSGSNAKRSKSNGSTTPKGQKSLKGFFAAKSSSSGLDGTTDFSQTPTNSQGEERESLPWTSPGKVSQPPSQELSPPPPSSTTPPRPTLKPTVSDPIATKESWGKLFIKPSVPKCEHDEPCKTMLTKKAGVNCGRSFWMCKRPLGPSGQKEKGTQWRCATFIWCSDWNGNGIGAGGT